MYLDDPNFSGLRKVTTPPQGEGAWKKGEELEAETEGAKLLQMPVFRPILKFKASEFRYSTDNL